jgi:uncharacterized protein YbgA (DUF1722 family)/uncharacterized protein YbbK (DUF523 family)
MKEKIKLGISACLLGQNVRYDGGHSRDPFITETLAEYIDFIPVCPEIEYGFPVPRETLKLVGDPKSPRLMTTYTKKDHTDAMRQWAARKLKELEKLDLWGFIFKSKSPSSGMERVKVYNEKGVPVSLGVGVFAAAFMEHFPLLPVEDEGRLHDPALRENFIESVFTLKRWRDVLNGNPKSKDLIEFHARHKLLFMAHSQNNLRSMGELIAEIKNYELKPFRTQYQELLVKILKVKPTVSKHVNALMQAFGYFKKLITPDEKQEILETIESFKAGAVPLIVPVTLLNHYIRQYDRAYLKDQYYFNPHPIELLLRNHA